ncbi:hypothetical protein DFH06DRAFT_1476343 [Mycena polygramma]|nr:hypothetical protein DFH06DRAFT_1476343 [Mycena polygramma]
MLYSQSSPTATFHRSSLLRRRFEKEITPRCTRPKSGGTRDRRACPLGEADVGGPGNLESTKPGIRTRCTQANYRISTHASRTIRGQLKLTLNGQFVLCNYIHILTCWDVHSGKLVWQHQSALEDAAVLAFTADETNGGDHLVVMICQRTIPTNGDGTNFIEIVDLNPRSGFYHILLTMRSPPSHHENPFSQAIICNEMAAVAGPGTQDGYLIHNWKLQSCFILSGPTNEMRLALIPGYIILKTMALSHLRCGEDYLYLINGRDAFEMYGTGPPETGLFNFVSVAQIPKILTRRFPSSTTAPPFPVCHHELYVHARPLHPDSYCIWASNLRMSDDGSFDDRLLCSYDFPLSPSQPPQWRERTGSPMRGDMVTDSITYSGHTHKFTRWPSSTLQIVPPILTSSPDKLVLLNCRDYVDVSPYSGALTYATNEAIIVLLYIELRFPSPLDTAICYTKEIVVRDMMSSKIATACALFNPRVSIDPPQLYRQFNFEMRTYTATTVAFFPVPAVLYFLVLSIAAKIAERFLSRFSAVFQKLSFDHQRNTVAYVMTTFWSTVALAVQLSASPILAERYTPDRIDSVKLVALITCGLYIFELIYLPKLTTSVLIHHCCTLFSTVLVIYTLQETQNPALASLGLIWLGHATTIQPMYIGLTMHRLRFAKRRVQLTLYFAAAQSLLFKFALSIYLYVWWGLKLASKNQSPIEIAFNVLFVVVVTALMTTQGCGPWAMWSIARGMDRKSDAEKQLQSVANSETSHSDTGKERISNSDSDASSP